MQRNYEHSDRERGMPPRGESSRRDEDERYGYEARRRGGEYGRYVGDDERGLRDDYETRGRDYDDEQFGWASGGYRARRQGDDRPFSRDDEQRWRGRETEERWVRGSRGHDEDRRDDRDRDDYPRYSERDYGDRGGYYGGGARERGAIGSYGGYGERGGGSIGSGYRGRAHDRGGYDRDRGGYDRGGYDRGGYEGRGRYGGHEDRDEYERRARGYGEPYRPERDDEYAGIRRGGRR